MSGSENTSLRTPKDCRQAKNACLTLPNDTVLESALAVTPLLGIHSLTMYPFCQSPIHQATAAQSLPCQEPDKPQFAG